MKRKAAWAAAGIVPTLIAANYMPRFVLYGFAAIIFIATVILAFFRYRRLFIRTFFLLGAASIAICVFLIQYEMIHMPLRIYDKQRIEADVVFTGGQANYWNVRIQKATCQNKPIYLRGTCSIPVYDYVIEPYDVGQIEFTLTSSTNKDDASFVVTDVEIIRVSHPETASISQRLDSFRNQIVTLLQVRIGGEEGNLAAAFLTGERNDLSLETQIGFARTGLSHVMAVSGLHLSIITGMVSYLFSKMAANKKIISTICLLFVGLVVVLGGFSVSVVRAGIMSAIMFVGHLFDRRADSLNSLGLALSIIALLFPSSVIDPSYLLSGAATVGILVLSPLLEEWILQSILVTKHQRQQISLVCVSVSSSIFTAPILILYYGELSTLSVPAMSLVNYPVTAVLIGSVLLCCLFWVPFLGDFVAFFIRITAQLILGAVDALSGFEQATVSFYSIPMIVFASLGILLGLGIYLLRKRIAVRRIVSCCLLTLMAISLCAAQFYHYAFSKLVVLGEFSGECGIYIDKGKAVVVNCGNRTLANDAQALLKQHGFDHIDLLFVTGLDSELSAGVPSLLADIPAKQVVISRNDRYNEVYRRIIAASDRIGATTVFIADDMKITLDDLTFDLYDLGDHDSSFSVIADKNDKAIGFFPCVDREILIHGNYLPHGELYVNTLVTGTCTPKGMIESRFIYMTNPQTVIAQMTGRHDAELSDSEKYAIISTGAQYTEITPLRSKVIYNYQMG